MKRHWFISLFLTIAAATVASAAEPPFDVRLIEPANHVVLAAGSPVPIAWQATNTPVTAEEWEAFLSIDGGRTYPIRITPHLNISIQRFAWTVPSLPGAELSILLRLGNEREEHEFSFPLRTTIRGASLGMAEDEIRRRLLTESDSEDDHGLILDDWVDGSRDGSDLKRVVVDHSQLVGSREWRCNPTRRSSPAISSSSKRFLPDTRASLGSGNASACGRRANRRVLLLARVLVLTQRLNV